MVAGSRALEQLGEALAVPQAGRRPGPNAVVSLPLELIVEPPPERRIRDVCADEDLDTLIESLREHGLLHPVGVRPLPDGHFELVYGGRRVAAARRLGWTVVQASLHLDLEDEPALVAGLAENLHRKDLAPRERVAALRLLAQIHQPGTQLGGTNPTGEWQGIRGAPRQPTSAGGLARRLNVNATTMQRLIGLAHDEELLGLVEGGAVSMTSAAYLSRLPPGQARATLLERVQTDGMGSTLVLREVKRALRERASSPEPGPGRWAASPALHRLRQSLGLLAGVDAVETDQEHQVLEQIGEHVQRLRAS